MIRVWDMKNKEYFNSTAISQYMKGSTSSFERPDLLRHYIANDIPLYFLSARIGEKNNEGRFLHRWIRDAFNTFPEVLENIAFWENDEDISISNIEIIPEKELDKKYVKFSEDGKTSEEMDYTKRFFMFGGNYHSEAEYLYNYVPEPSKKRKNSSKK